MTILKFKIMSIYWDFFFFQETTIYLTLLFAKHTVIRLWSRLKQLVGDWMGKVFLVHFHPQKWVLHTSIPTAFSQNIFNLYAYILLGNITEQIWMKEKNFFLRMTWKYFGHHCIFDKLRNSMWLKHDFFLDDMAFVPGNFSDLVQTWPLRTRLLSFNYWTDREKRGCQLGLPLPF